MQVLYQPQFNNNEKIQYSFEANKVTIGINEQKEVFDFRDMSDVFEFCPIISAERKKGILYLELLNFIDLDATKEGCFPESQEVIFDG